MKNTIIRNTITIVLLIVGLIITSYNCKNEDLKEKQLTSDTVKIGNGIIAKINEGYVFSFPDSAPVETGSDGKICYTFVRIKDEPKSNDSILYNNIIDALIDPTESNISEIKGTLTKINNFTSKIVTADKIKFDLSKIKFATFISLPDSSGNLICAHERTKVHVKKPRPFIGSDPCTQYGDFIQCACIYPNSTLCCCSKRKE